MSFQTCMWFFLP